jgi:heme exporter protein D
MIAKFFAMGGYAAYIWSAYGISCVGVFVALGVTIRAYRRAVARLAAMDNVRR